MNNKLIPVTILTGFLGSGKTTLLNNIIRKYPNKKFAVVENEIGQEGIDGGLIVASIENMVELSNGCICCNLSDDLIKTLDNLLSGKFSFDHLLIETTGIADPAGVIDIFVGYKEFLDKFQIDSVICLADAQTYEDAVVEQPEIHRQLAVSDIVLLNKFEDVSPEYGQKIKELVRSVNPSAKLYTTSHANINDIEILDQFSFKGKNVEKMVMDFSNLSMMNVNNINTESQFAMNTNKQNTFNHNIVSEAFTVNGQMDPQRFSAWIEGVLQYNSASVFRIKGILSIKGSDKKLIFQSVRQFFMTEDGDDWKEGEQRFTKLVFIGRKLNKNMIQEFLESFVVE